jgi:hypothetical protein
MLRRPFARELEAEHSPVSVGQTFAVPILGGLHHPSVTFRQEQRRSV